MEHLQATSDPKEQQKANIHTNRAKKEKNTCNFPEPTHVM